ncbi:hypothetical protein COM26_04185 [Bacillus toyonensis]|nr:hypothetical protein CN687_11740 [Bacillus toyonensis]PEL03000.1 hypothetical protein CN614_24250 [Bacillus toyonensis]PEU38855.1 hypothetical protein CN537_19235 [Bacillus toyonensis]PGC99714.1 hypothetical protein COM26_04185 [Bacillus toyonensis]PGE17224.1 hypothetical protein COM64_17335 [Bacillus toyonensis]
MVILYRYSYSKQCNNIVTEKDADFCMMDKKKYKGKVYCESCRSNWSVDSKVEVKCAHDNCYVNITENVKQYCENHKGLFGGKYYCYNHQQDMKIQNDKVCDLCGNKVPPNVIAFCEQNSERFSGHIYCYNHQKNF